MNFFEFEEDIFDDDLDILEIIDIGFPKLKYTRSDQFHDLDDACFFKRFRLTKATVLNLLIGIESNLEFPNNINHSISSMNQLLTALRFYATAGHLTAIADYMGMHTTTACRIIKKVSSTIAQQYNQYIRMPSTADEINASQSRFYAIARFPRVISAIDGTHIKIQSPGGNDGEIFRNRKSYFSLNVQVAGGADLKIQDVVARWPGSAHDATIFMASRIRQRCENGDFGNSIILGDSGYPSKSYLLTPLLNTTNRKEQLYNESHIRTRNVVERLFGVWKRRFPVLAYGIRLKVDTVMAVIVATAVLHNIAIDMKEQMPPLPNDFEMLIANGQILEDAQRDIAVHHVRRDLIDNYFSTL